MSDWNRSIREALETHRNGAVHLMGIGGVGMAGLAGLLRHRGYAVDGCDVLGNRFTARLQAQGIPVLHGHDPNHVNADPFLLVRSTAVSATHSELVRAMDRGIPVFRRGEVFAALLQDQFTVAISGTHGKTTTTALCAHAVRGAGKAPTYFVGGEWEGEGRVFVAGADPITIVEADESDATLVRYRPDIAVITGMDYDHMEHFSDEQAFFHVFEQFIGNTREAIVYCSDDERLRALIPDAAGALSYGLTSDAQYRAVDVREHAQGSEFIVEYKGSRMGLCRLPIPGAHNMLNALAALAVVHQLGLPINRAIASMHTFIPVRRRFERIAVWRGVPVYSDYAHHPTAIRALVASVRKLAPRRALAIFQPHRYTRTRALGPDFPPAFEGIDHVILAPVYPASEKPVQGGDIRDLAAHFHRYGGISFKVANDLDQAWNVFEGMAAEGDVLLLIGAGDIERLGMKCFEVDDKG